MWRVLPLCLLLLTTGLTSCNSSLETDSNQDWSPFSFFSFSQITDGAEANLIERDELPEWLIPIVSEREKKDSSTAVFTAEVNGKLLYNIFYISKGTFLLRSDGYVDLYYSDGTKVPFLDGLGTGILYHPKEWCMIYCAHPELYRFQKRQELMEKDELPEWMINKIDSCTSIAVALLTREDQQAYTIFGALKPTLISDRAVLCGTYFPDGTRCTYEETQYFGHSTDWCTIYLQEKE